MQKEAEPQTERDAPEEPVFRARGLSRIYRMGEVEVVALRRVDLDLYRGEFVVILGPSGGGKSTLLNILGGLDAPTSGEVIFRDHRLTGASETELTRFRREHVGFVFQFYNLIPSLTALENVSLVTEICDHPLDAVEALRMVGLGDRMNHFPAQLSGGEQQRVAIARALANSPALILADEPTGELDAATGERLLELFAQLHRDGTTLVFVTHDAIVAKSAQRVIRLRDGVVAEDTGASS